MPRYALVCLVSALVTLGVLACGDDDDSSSSPTPSTASPTETIGDGRTSPPTASLTDAPNDKTAPPSGSDDETPGPTAPGPTPTAPPTASVGTPAPEITGGALAEYEGQLITYEDCQYNPNTAQVICGDVIYAIDPPLVAQDITCQLGIVEEKAVLVFCNTFSPYVVHFYKVPE